jgi:hypothetical protein
LRANPIPQSSSHSGLDGCGAGCTDHFRRQGRLFASRTVSWKRDHSAKAQEPNSMNPTVTMKNMANSAMEPPASVLWRSHYYDSRRAMLGEQQILIFIFSSDVAKF